MGEHPERIWVTGVERYIGFYRITASSLDHSGAGEGYEYPEYVRANLYDALRAQVEAMTAPRDDFGGRRAACFELKRERA
mgnify:CR=1 FL=1